MYKSERQSAATKYNNTQSPLTSLWLRRCRALLCVNMMSPRYNRSVTSAITTKRKRERNYEKLKVLNTKACNLTYFTYAAMRLWGTCRIIPKSRLLYSVASECSKTAKWHLTGCKYGTYFTAPARKQRRAEITSSRNAQPKYAATQNIKRFRRVCRGRMWVPETLRRLAFVMLGVYGCSTVPLISLFSWLDDDVAAEIVGIPTSLLSLEAFGPLRARDRDGRSSHSCSWVAKHT